MSTDPPDAVHPVEEPVVDHRSEEHPPPRTMIPARERRRLGAERLLVRLVATGGIVGIAVLLGAILVSQDVAGWIVGLVTGLVSVLLAAVLWSSREV